MIVDDVSRREFVIGAAALAALLTGCGTGAAGPAADGRYPRTVTDASGDDVLIEARPQRIACAQNVWDLDAVLALGEVPVQFGLRDFATYTGSPTTSWPWNERVLAEEGARSERLPVGEELSVEAIARSTPDLIVGDSAVEAVRDRLSALAPVLQTASFDWRRNLRLLGDVLDLSADAEALIAQTDQRLASSLDAYDLGGARAAVFGVYDATSFYLFGDASIPVVDLMTRAGFGMLDDLVATATPDEARVEYSAEQLGLLEPADLIVGVRLRGRRCRGLDRRQPPVRSAPRRAGRPGAGRRAGRAGAGPVGVQPAEPAARPGPRAGVRPARHPRVLTSGQPPRRPDAACRTTSTCRSRARFCRPGPARAGGRAW